jgi:hypothetical protein
MPEARVWSELADRTICEMRNEGATWAAIGRTLGLSRNTVIERGPGGSGAGEACFG